jgi:acyl transferase domain-containing protein
MTLNRQDELLERARKVIRELREKLSVAEARSQSEPIAVIGMGIRFPGCGSDREQFWRMIVEGRDAVKSVPADRWDRDSFHTLQTPTPGKMNTRHGAFLDDVRRFDAAFFDITPREAVRMDPQQRIFLETAWHALEDAGLPKARIVGSDTGVFVGVHNHSADYQSMQFGNLTELDAYAATGTAHDVIAGRLAYWLDLHGPALAINTACSSSLTAVHLACRSLRAADCTAAIVGGVNLLLTPGATVAMAQLQLLSGDGRCKAFDARADGMGRGEGCGVIVLKKLDAAVADGDRVLAIIRGSAMNQDGKTNGLTAPNGMAQRRVLQSAFKDARVEPWEIGYLEAHGTGTALGDPIEVEALAATLGAAQRNEPCTLGALKANIGHLEGAAGIAGLIKTVLVLQHRWLPPVVNLEKLNPHIALDETSLNIPRQGHAWTAGGRRLAGVSSFGWSGTNVHVVLEEAPVATEVAPPARDWPVLISAQSPEALETLAIAYADRLERAEARELAGISYTSTMRRTHLAHRIAVTGSIQKAMASQLRRRAAPSKIETASSEPSTNGSPHLDETLRAWEAGRDVDWAAIFPVPAGVVDLPLYPFQGKPYWLNTPSASSATADSFPQDWVYSTEWIEKPFDKQAASPEIHPMTWLLFVTKAESGEWLAAAARQRGHRIIEVRRGEGLLRKSVDEIVIGDDFSDGVRQIFEVLAREGVRPDRVLYLSGGEDAATATREALEIAKAVLQSGISPKLWFIAQSSESLTRPEATSHPEQCALRGFSRVFGLEHPDLAGGVIEIDSMCEETLSALCEEIAQTSCEDRVALQRGNRLVPRLHRDPPADDRQRLKLGADKFYLVTGAFGRLGMKAASWLVDCGARYLALIGRRGPSEMGDPELMKRLAAWREQGVTVVAEACDAADESQIRGLLAKIRDSGRTLVGVIHAAGSARFSPIAEAPVEDVDSAFRAKVEGARILDRCTREYALDFFVLFGSAAATIGLRNGALYAAANSSLDGIRLARQSQRLPVLLVEWGAWEDSDLEKRHELVRRSGFAEMQSGRAFRALGALIASARTSGLVADIDWAMLGPALEMRGRQALIAGLIDEPAPSVKAPDAPTETAWLDELRDLPAQKRADRVLDFVGDAARKVFGMTAQDRLDEHRGLFQMGMDSLMSVKLKRRLEAGTGLRLPGTLTLTQPTITALAQYLEGRLFPAEVQPVGGELPSTPTKRDTIEISSVAGMSDSEIDIAIAAELDAIQQKLGAL